MGRIAIHDIAAVSYLHDDDQHLVIIKAGINTNCRKLKNT